MNFGKTRHRSRRNSMNVVTTEKWKNYRKRTISKKEIIRAESDDEDPKYEEIKDWVQEFLENKNSPDETKTDQDVEVKLTQRQTLILSTLVPDEILMIENFDHKEPKRFVGVLLMADVSGYTALSERYNNTGKGGTYRLTVTLNTYLGSLIELIYSHGGDILKFAGDAFLALWKTDKRTFLSHTIHKVIACALLIQHSYSTYETDVKVSLRVKLAIAAGNLMFAPIGTGIDMNYVIIGLPVLEAKAAESVCSSGEVKLARTAWGHCYSRNYDHIIHDDGHVTIKSILYDPHENDVTKPFLGFNALVKQIKRPLNASENLPEFLFEPNKNLSQAEVLKKSEILSLRKTICVAEERNLGSDIRKFMIRPVLTQIDAHQPLEYLTEMRQVSILFLTLKPRNCPFLQLITIVNNAYQITCEIVYKSMGCVNKIILFDKDVMILVVFGVRGFKHESEAQAALKCGFNIRKSVSGLDGVLEVSIGVTTGQVYCGVVGHPLRREFTVIGAIVNKAARLMCGFRNKITCDETTFIKSKMSSNGFTLQPETELKGIGQSGKIYEYTEDIRIKELYDIPMMPCLLDREDEMEYYSNWLNSAQPFRDFDALLIVGESRIGKSRLLEWMSRHAKNASHNVNIVTLSTIHSATPYLALNQIFNQILGLYEPVVGFIKEEKIIQLLTVYNDDLCYLNQILNVRFAFNDGHGLDDDKRKEIAKIVFTKIVSAIHETQLIFLDDLQNLDAPSWEFISLMLGHSKIFTIFSVNRGKFSSIQDWLYKLFVDNNIRKMVLGPLPPSVIPAIACQFLDCDAVPKDLCDALLSKSGGMPGLVEGFIIHLFSNGALELKKIQEDEKDKWTEYDLQYPDPSLLHPQAVDIKDQPALDELIELNHTGEIGICIVTEKDELKTDFNVQNLDTLIMIQIDSLTPYQQLLLKIASVIGNVVSRDLLESIMYENNPITTAKAIKRLFAMRILTCASSTSARIKSERKLTSEPNQPPTIESNLTCGCSFEYDPENVEMLPKYAFCRILKFKNKNASKTCYELLPLNQKKEFHSRIVHYLESNKHKCPTCGGALMVVQSLISLASFTSASSSYLQEQTSSSDSENSVDDDVGDEAKYCLSTSEKTVKDQSVSYERGNLKKCNSEEIIREDLHAEESAFLNKIKKQYNSILKINGRSNSDAMRRRSKRVTMTNDNIDINLKPNTPFPDIKVFERLREVTEAENIKDWHNLGVVDSKDDLITQKQEKNHTRQSLCIKLEKSVSQTNMAKCTCADLRVTIYEQLITHALHAELKSKAIEFHITSCYLNLLSNNVEIVFPSLETAEKMCYEDPNLATPLKKRFLGKLYSLRAAACLMSGRISASKIALERAMKLYKINFEVAGFFHVKDALNLIKMKRKAYREHKIAMLSDSVYCLNVLTLLSSMTGEQRTAKLSSARALQIIQDVECPVVDICDAYSNAIIIELDRGTPEYTAEIERMASHTLRNLAKPIQADELYAVGKLFMESFRARLARGQLAAAVRSGFRAITVSRFLQAHNVSLEIVPDLFYVLLSRKRIEEAMDVLKLTLGLGDKQASDCETWYYALCMDMILDAGFQLENPVDISRYAEFSISRGKSGGNSRRRLVVGLWTYWLRADSEKKARRFESEALSWTANEEDDGSMTTLLCSLRLAEGMLESLAKKVDDLKKVVDLMELRSIADRELVRMERDVRVMRAVYPRWLLLKANCLKLSSRGQAATALFNQASEEARRINNCLEEALARAALSRSVFWTQNARASCFMDWQAGTEHARSSWYQIMYRITTTRRV